MPVMQPEVYTSMGLNEGEYKRILELMGREPTLTELGMFAVMWSEHCGYKYSRPILSAFAKYKEALEGDGFENAGVVDLGDGIGVTMKIESHNHPSAVEPYQGAATGVGGIIRDILTMGARPIACLNSLRFGTISDGAEASEVVDRNRYLFEHVVAGIAGYGNCVGVPTVGGEVSFHPSYSGNPLVNAMCVGVLNLADLTTASASGTGNPVLYLGSATGKDGIHGATFASDALGEDGEAKRPNVQIGDPFAEKLLIEATLEALATGAVVAIQDMGAAGLTCSTIEMAAKGEVGMTVNLDDVPMRESDMSAYELMLSESQERMLAVARLGREHEVISIFHKWGLPAKVIGYVTAERVVRVSRFGRVEAEVDPRWLADECPTYTNEAIAPQEIAIAKTFDLSTIPEGNPKESLLRLLAVPEIASKRWVYEQYDQQVLTQSVLLPGKGDAAVIALRGTTKGIALSVDGNSRMTRLAPYIGGQLAVAEAARNVACTGAVPRAITDGLNFGSPTDPGVYYQFKHAVQGIADAAEAMGTPVISGNVSFYNRSDLGEIPPTPLIGMLGVLEEVSYRLPSAPRDADRLEILLLDAGHISSGFHGLGGSAILAYVHGIESGVPDAPDMPAERKLCEAVSELARRRLILSAHDCSDGGLLVALAEICLQSGSGMVIELPESTQRMEARLFGESPGRVIVTVSSSNKDKVMHEMQLAGIPAVNLGTMGVGTNLVCNVNTHPIMGVELKDIEHAFEASIPNTMKKAAIY